MPLNSLAGLIAFLGGAALAWGFLTHLRWTLRRLPHSRSPVAFWTVHWILRLGGVTLVLIAIAQAGGWLLLTAVAGFAVTKLGLTGLQAAPAGPGWKTQ